MPGPRNAAFKTYMNRIKQLDDSPEGITIKRNLIAPLDAILKVDLAAVDAQKKVIQAITAHSGFWGKPPFGLAPRDAATEAADDAFLANDPADFKLIKQQAAEQRVLLGLKQVRDEDVLLGILNSTSDALRDYIGKKPEFGKLDAIPGWKTPGASPKHNKEILSDAILTEIQKNAAELLLAKKIAAATDNALLLALVVAADGPTTIDAVRKLGVPYDLHPVPADLLTAAKDLYVKQAYSAYVANESRTTALTDLNDILVKNDLDFKADMQAKLKLAGPPGPVDITAEQIKAARTELATSYLQRRLADPALAVKPADINAIDSVEKMVAFVNKTPTDKKITDTITPENLTALKTTLVNNFIAKLTAADVAALNKLSAAKKIEEVKPILEQMGIKPTAWIDAQAMGKIIDAGAAKLEGLKKANVDTLIPRIAKAADFDELMKLAKITKLDEFIDEFRSKFGTAAALIETPQMLQLQQKICNRALELKIAKLSALGTEPHSGLIGVLQSLPIKKQMELLEPGNSALGHLLKSTNEMQIRHYLGEEINLDPRAVVDVGGLIRNIITENERIASFQKVQNSAFAAVLASFASAEMRAGLPKVEALTTQQIKDFNDKLKVTDFNVPAQVKALADIIIKPPHTQAEKEARDALATHISDHKADIVKQIATNKPLIDIYANRTSVGKAVLDVLLRLDVDVKYGDKEKEFKDALFTALNKHHTKVEDFIDSLCDSPDIVKPDAPPVTPATKDVLKAALKKEFSQAEFSQIAVAWQKQVLSDPAYGPQSKVAVLTSIVNTMKDIKPLLQPADPLAAFTKAEFSGFAYDAMTRENNPGAKKEVYMERLAKNTVTIDRLMKAQEQLQACFDSLPTKPPASDDANIKKIRKELEEDLKLLKDALEKYEAAQKKIISTIKDIDRIMANNEHYLYQASDITTKPLTATELAALKSTTGSHVSGTVGSDPDIAARVALDSGQKSHKCIVTDHSDPSKPGTIGEFTQTIGESSRTHVHSDGTISKRPNIKIEMTAPPTVVGTGAPGPAHAQAAMYMNMALAMIVANGGRPPSKDSPFNLRGGSKEEMEGLWTALHMICKEKYGYSHSKFMDAVSIQTGSFNPKDVMTPGRFPWSEPTFNDKSLYTKLFHKDALSENVVALKLKDVDKIKEQVATQTAGIVAGSKALSEYKATVSSGRTAEALQKASEVRATEGVSKPDVEPSQLQHPR